MLHLFPNLLLLFNYHTQKFLHFQFKLYKLYKKYYNMKKVYFFSKAKRKTKKKKSSSKNYRFRKGILFC